MYRLIRLVLVALLSVHGTAATAAQPVESNFIISLRGLTVGSLHLAARQDGARYAVAARIEDSGLLGVFRSFSYRGSSRGILQGQRIVPLHSQEVADTGRRQSEAVLDYAGGVPRVTRYASSGPSAKDRPDPATQVDTVDPATALYALFRDRPENDACDRTVVMFDGMRRSHLVLGAPRREGALLRCAGEYRRLQGFTDRELSRHVAFPLEVTLAPAGGLMRVMRVEIASSYGRAALDRR